MPSRTLGWSLVGEAGSDWSTTVVGLRVSIPLMGGVDVAVPSMTLVRSLIGKAGIGWSATLIGLGVIALMEVGGGVPSRTLGWSLVDNRLLSPLSLPWWVVIARPTLSASEDARR